MREATFATEKVESKTITYAAGTTGAQGAATLFTVTGAVLAKVYAVCEVDLTGALATIEVGIVGLTAGFIAQTVATGIDANNAWIDATLALIKADPSFKLIGAGQDIIQTIATADITGGRLKYYCVWKPLSEGATVVAA